MGADLYIEKLPDKAEGYFRDSYNRSNLLWQFGMSYWTDVSKRYTKNGRMTVTRAKMLLEELKEKEPVFLQNMQDLLEKKNEIWDYETDLKTKKETYKPAELSDDERKEWVISYIRDYRHFKEFLTRAIELKSAIECSL